MRIYPDSFASPCYLVLWLSLPTFGIDAPLPSLSATGDDLGTTSAELGLATSVYLMSLGAPLSLMRVGRNPIVLFGCALVVHFAVEGAGASATAIAAFAIVRDIFDGGAGGAKMANVILAIYIVPMIASTVGAALLALSSWRAIYLVPIAGGLMLLMRQIPEIMGSISAARTFVQMIGAASSSAIDGHCVFSTAVVMFAFCLLSGAACVGIVLPAKAEPKSTEGRPSSGGK